MQVVCADIGGSFIKFGISQAPGQIIELGRVPTPHDDWQEMVRQLGNLIGSAGVGPDVPLGLSVTGLVDPATGVGLSANVPAFNGMPIAQALSEALERPVHAANDADCLTLAEANEGVGQGYPIVLCIIIGTGIGGGLVVDGRLVRGAGGVTGEWGHGPIVNTSVEIDGRTVFMPRLACGCGQQGCVDTIGGARGIERIHSHLHGEEQSSYEILTRWHASDVQAGNTVEAYLQLVADPLALAVNITGASIVPVGGGLSSDARLIARLDEAVRSRVLHRLERPLVVPALRAQEGGLIGAAVLARQEGARVHAA